ncbi:hypothetical protein DV451_003196 [Geotrichum candidum]|uniref:Uncharacterized protein n=1 Tax=Geotrichum candidum TaxID=1173061 RepID=A0A9P5KTQ9_GEOCN|nr:hypothetical protein DV451_003196 [Geotrichum candidum]KAF5106788.1 hypothetical protein DV453_003604 [Geotrichum candidum]
MVRVNILDTEITNFFETKLFDEGISAIEYHLLLDSPDEIKIPGPEHLRLLLSLAVLPEAHLTSTADNAKSQQTSIATRAITVLNLIKELAKDNDHVQEVIFESIKLPVSGDRSGRHRSRRADPEFTSYIPSSYLVDHEEGLESGSSRKRKQGKREETHSNKKISLRKRKSMNELDALIFSDEEENDDDKDKFSGIFIDAHKRGNIARAKLAEEHTLSAVETEECVRMEKTIHATLASFAVV